MLPPTRRFGLLVPAKRPGGEQFIAFIEKELMPYIDHRPSALGYRSPHQFEQDLKITPPRLTVRCYWTVPSNTKEI
jgi:hypothetical protein